MELPLLPCDFTAFIPYLNKSSSRLHLSEATQPYIEYESKLRQIFAQQPQHEAVKGNHLVPVFADGQLLTQARNKQAELQVDREKYILEISDSQRRQNATPATICSLKDFKTNFSVFSEQSLIDLDWSNVVAAGSSVVTALLPVSANHNASKKALRSYYHEQLAPASDVDLFIYGLNEEQAIEKIKSIETSIRDSILSETTTIRTKNAITIVSEYPTRHVQIVLRLYNSITEILTGFDVDCSCVAYDGEQVWASPRALAAFALQQNSIDLTRRSPSYENRLSKYAHRGFEVFWPYIDRARIDPTIYERSFNRVVGLARLLVLEKLPHPSDRDSYAEKRRQERGRPELPWNSRYRHALPGNVKDAQPDDVPEWLNDENHSDYHTFTIPYGPKYNAKKIEKLLFKQDLLLNAEWNKPKDRGTKLHRHPAFFGTVEDIVHDCCGFCPEPETDEDLKVHEEESKLYISGDLRFMKDDPGRQAIGSFNPLTNDDWTDMAYVGSTSQLFQAIVDHDIEKVRDWFNEEGANVNRRDHTGRTPLQLACMCSSPEIVQLLIERGARIVSRIYNGLTALHMAAHRGDAKIVSLLLDKSEQNEAEDDRREEIRKLARRVAVNFKADADMTQVNDDDIEVIDDDYDGESDPDDAMTEGSFVKVNEGKVEEENEDEPDVYDVDVLAWDSPVSALHLAIMGGHIDVIKVLVDKYAADILLPVKLRKINYYGPHTILNLVLPLHLSQQKANETIRTLLARGASPAQADGKEISNLHYLVSQAKIQILDILNDEKGEAIPKIINHLVVQGHRYDPTYDTPLLTAIRLGSADLVRKVLNLGADLTIKFEPFVRAYTQKFDQAEKDPDTLKILYNTHIEQPILEMVKCHGLVDVVVDLVDGDINVNLLTKGASRMVSNGRKHFHGHEVKSLLDMVRDRVEELESYTDEETEPSQKPDPLPDFKDAECVGYESWILQTNYAEAEEIHRQHITRYEEHLEQYQKNSRDNKRGSVEKKQAITEALVKWQVLETKLRSKGAKTFAELYPDLTEQQQSQRYHPWMPGKSGLNKDKDFENKVSFQIPDLTDSKRAKYLQLFEAVYAGNIDAVKTLCLNAESPIQIAVMDTAGFNPFSLAVLREHYDLARLVLEVAAAQYQPFNPEKKLHKYSISPFNDFDSKSDSDEDSDSDDADFPEFYKELVDEKYTIDDIRVLSDNVKSRTSPATLFALPCELWRTLPLSEPNAKKAFQPPAQNHHFHPHYADEHAPIAWFNEIVSRERNRHGFSLFRYVIISNNMSMLKFLLHLQRNFIYQKEDESTLQKLQLREDDFDIALRLGRTDMISEIIQQTGTLLPLATLAEKTGVELEEEPQYYQGLSVYGEKKKEWAQQDRKQRNSYKAESGSPLLAAILSGNIKSVEYFLSDTPLRCYEEFARRFQHDKHIQLLTRSEGGLDRVLHDWMNTRTHLAIHMAVMADPKISKPVRSFVIHRMPQFINAKSKDGMSPIHLAFDLANYDAARELISAGADQKTRENSGRNILHTIYVRRNNTENADSLRQVVEILDPNVLQPLALQRSFGDGPEAKTPLMSFLSTGWLRDVEDKSVLDFMFEISAEKDLEVMDGAGDFPLHSLVRSGGALDVIQFIASRRPDLLFKENATGATPLEIAENSFLKAMMDSPPQVNISHSSGRLNLAHTPKVNFLDPYNFKPQTKQYPAQAVHDALQEIAASHPKYRSLVSLLDANETARRLAAQQRKNNQEMIEREAKGLKSYHSRRRWYGYDNRNAPNDQDEVSFWGNKAAELQLKDFELDGYVAAGKFNMWSQ